MKAAVFEGIEKLVVTEVPTPEPDADSMLVKVHACAVCGSDVRIFHHGNPRLKPPQTPGHEIAGEIEAVGENVAGFEPGERVAVGADVPCGVCEFCRAGLGNNCQINYAIGYQFPGGFAEYILLNETTVKYGPIHKIPGDLSYEEACLAEPLACCLNGLELTPVPAGGTVLIFGAGPVGILIARLARHLGAARVFVAEVSPSRAEQAKELAAGEVFPADEGLQERVLAETDGLGVDVALTACPSPEAQMQALRMVRSRGKVNFFGGLPKGTPPLTVDSNLVHYKEMLVTGSHGCVPRHHQAALNLIAAGAIRVDDLITHRFPLDEVLAAFQAAEDRAGLKAIVNPL
ncbi:MAG: zinc-dependent dehydrogenase [Armatimonadota bacterium]